MRRQLSSVTVTEKLTFISHKLLIVFKFGPSVGVEFRMYRHTNKILNTAVSKTNNQSLVGFTEFTDMNTKKREIQASSAKRLKHSASNNDLESIKKKTIKEEENKKFNVVLPDPNSFLSSEEKVFSIDHIVESILLKLDREALMTCRLLSRRWAYFGSKALQNIVTITFLRDSDYPGDSKGCIFMSNTRKSKRPIDDLIDLMNTAREFPCTSFCFINCMEKSLIAALDPFFSAHGFLIRKLKFEAVLHFDDLRSILHHPALNLKELSLRNRIEYDESKSLSLIEEAPLKLSTLGETLLKNDLKERTLVLKNLKVFKCSIFNHDAIIQQILELSPNLVEVSVKQDNLHCLVKPSNRLHLVKKLDIDTDQDLQNFDPLEAVANSDQNNWAVKKVIFGGQDECFNGDICPKFVSILYPILLGCSAIVTYFVWYRNNSIPEHFQIPRMPRLKHLSFNYNVNVDTGLPINNFPKGVSFEDMFPNLKSLEIFSGYSMKNLPIENIFGDNNPLPVPKVTKVDLGFYADENLLRSFKEMFPNATIQMNEDDSEEEEDHDMDEDKDDEDDSEEEEEDHDMDEDKDDEDDSEEEEDLHMDEDKDDEDECDEEEKEL